MTTAQETTLSDFICYAARPGPPETGPAQAAEVITSLAANGPPPEIGLSGHGNRESVRTNLAVLSTLF
jgi:hypothetical protein